MGDKTQLLALVLAARFRKPWTIMAAIFVATLLNHGLAAWGGAYVAAWVAPDHLRWALAFLFFAFGFWILIPDKDSEAPESGMFGAFLTTLIAFFLAEMGDKTQLATVALGGRYSNVWLVTVGTTLGMMASNAMVIFFGDRLLKRIPMNWIRRAACALFLLFGALILAGF